MPRPAVSCPTSSPASPSNRLTSGSGGPNINPRTGLSTDYLNHFMEAVMVLEMVASMPECINDLRGWRPKTYAEHFAGSSFHNRELVIANYEKADPATRLALNRASELLNAMTDRTRELVLQNLG